MVVCRSWQLGTPIIIGSIARARARHIGDAWRHRSEWLLQIEHPSRVEDGDPETG